MTRAARRLVTSVVPLAIAASPAPSAGQEHPWAFELRLGLSSPKGDLGDLHDEGFYAGVGLARRLTSRLEVRIEGAFESLERGGRPDRLGGTKGPLADLWHATILAAFELSRPDAGPWEVGIGLGGGATFFEVGRSAMIGPRTGRWETLQGMLYGGFRAGDRWTLFVRADLLVMIEDVPEPEGYLSKEVAFINAAGVRIAF